MSFKVYDGKGYHIAWFDDIDKAIQSMLANPTHNYHRLH
jgi:spore germination protein YaaH